MLASLLALACLGSYGLFGYAQGQSPATDAGGFHLGFYALASLFVFVDMIDFFIRLYWRQLQTPPADATGAVPTSTPLDLEQLRPGQRRRYLRPYAVIVSVHNLGKEVQRFVDAMAPYHDHLWVIDDASTDDTFGRLQAAGVHCVRTPINRLKPGAIKRLLDELPVDIQTVLVLDPDTQILNSGRYGISDLETVIFEFQRSGMAAACPRITLRPDGWLARLQRFEYWLAFGLGRKSLGDHSITSGIAIYHRRLLQRLLESHTLSVYAEDLENTLHILAEGGRIYYDERLVVETEGKRDLTSWFSQRVGWSFGLIKVYLENLPGIWRFSHRRLMYFYHYVVYMGGFSLLLHPFKLTGLAILTASAVNGLDNALGLGWIADTPYTSVWYFPLAYAKYLILTLLAIPLVVGRGERWQQIPAALVYFLYMLVHLVPVTVGYLNWLSLLLLRRRIYRDHYAQDQHINGRP